MTTAPRTATGPRSAYATLASPSRVAILALLQRNGSSMPVERIAGAVQLHVNTVREHLDRLIAAHYVASERETRITRGRPRVLYRAITRPAAATMDALLRDYLFDMAEANVACDSGSPGSRHDQLAALEVDLLDLGIDIAVHPEPHLVDLRCCPFGPAAQHDTHRTICDVHWRLIDGVLTHAGGDLRVDHLDPLVAPGLCALYLSPGGSPGEVPPGRQQGTERR